MFTFLFLIAACAPLRVNYPDSGTSDLNGDSRSDSHDTAHNADSSESGVPDSVDSDFPDDSDSPVDTGPTDYDGDGIDDDTEIGPDPDHPVDTDEDGIPDWQDLDSDSDGLSDSTESGITKLGDTPRDTDGDGHPDYTDSDSDDDALGDDLERAIGTDPIVADTDGDSFDDGTERALGTDPLDGSSLPDGPVLTITVPEGESATGGVSLVPVIWKGDFAMLFDTTGGMLNELRALETDFDAIASAIALMLPDTAFGLAHYEDYYFTGMGHLGDKPFALDQQITTDVDLVSAAVDAASLHSGGSWTEAGFEALYQAASGAGYDQDCDAEFEDDTDILPFIAAGTDPFEGEAGGAGDATVGGGTIGGFGFRDGAFPIIIQTTDSPSTDPDDGDETPGGCPIDAGSSAAIDALNNIGARYVGVATATYPMTEMEEVAAGTGSLGDTDGDGEVDDVLVTYWDDTEPTGAYRTPVIEAVANLLDGATFSTVGLETEGDTWGFFGDVSPESYADVRPSDLVPLTYTVELYGAVSATERDQLFAFRLNLVGEGVTNLGFTYVVVRVPGTGV
jgi:hypothetical protein